jgi:hypothetical protein
MTYVSPTDTAVKDCNGEKPNCSILDVIYFETALNFVLPTLCTFSIILECAAKAYPRLRRFMLSNYGLTFNYFERYNEKHVFIYMLKRNQLNVDVVYTNTNFTIHNVTQNTFYTNGL